jgi:hypothetical protein
VKHIFTEIYEHIEEFREKHVDTLFEKYDHQLSRLLAEKKLLEEKQTAIKTADLRSWRTLMNRTLPFVIASALLVFFSYFARAFLPEYKHPETSRVLDLTVTVTAASLGLWIVLAFFRFGREKIETKLENEMLQAEYSRRLESINHELDTARSLLWARSRDFLVDAEIASETRKSRDQTSSLPGKPQGEKIEESLTAAEETQQVLEKKPPKSDPL